jgi:hypothetical protein
MTEAEILRDILIALGARKDVRLFRNSVGLARDTRTGAHVRFGLALGASDLIGIVRTPRGGLFLALEVKSERGRVTEEQNRFLAVIGEMQGVARVVRSVAEALAVIEEAVRV